MLYDCTLMEKKLKNNKKKKTHNQETCCTCAMISYLNSNEKSEDLGLRK